MYVCSFFIFIATATYRYIPTQLCSIATELCQFVHVPLSFSPRLPLHNAHMLPHKMYLLTVSLRSCPDFYVSADRNYLVESLHSHIHTYVCTYVRAYIHTYLPTYMHTYILHIRTCVRTSRAYACTYVHSFIRPPMISKPSIHPPIHPCYI